MADQTANTQPSSLPTLPSLSLWAATFKARLRQKKIAMGRPVSPTPSELARDNEEEMEAGATVLSNVFGHIFTLHPGGVLKKTGRSVHLGEADVLRAAAASASARQTFYARPQQAVYGTETTPGGGFRLSMEYIEGQTLSQVWPGLTHEEKTAYARQFRGILETMRTVSPPSSLSKEGETFIGACDGTEIRDGRVYDTYTAPTPAVLLDAFTQRLTKQPLHRIVLTHGDLAPRNIMVRDGVIVALVDWEDAGWYPEYWEFVKLFQRMAAMEPDWA
ncbi:hypothetical protein SBRCBS47491_000909 [Sporothrix bragantina]|uniref:non-specific serine/threonine protein kinase n=1 Tax=Sporothrix bragantina TaxID=671064 RepID=A0ABP0AU91_9PEZI